MSSSTKPGSSSVSQNVGDNEAIVPMQHEQTSPHELSPGGYSAQVIAPASLVAVGGPTAGRAYPLFGADFIIGRGAHASVVIHDRSVSSRHAMVRRVSSWHEVTDLGSTNGTLLNGRRLAPNRPAELHPGDTIQVAECVLVYLAEGMTDTSEVTQALAIASPALGGPGGSNLSPEDILGQILKMSMPQEEPKVSLDEKLEKVFVVLRVVRRYLPMVASLAAILALVGVGTVVVAPPLAEAAFTITLSPQASDNPVGDRNGQSNYFQFFAGAESTFTSPILVEKTLKALGHQNPSESLVNYTTHSLSFTNLAPAAAFAGTGPATYRGTFRHRNPSEAVRFLKAHVENYLQQEINKTLKVVQKQLDFLVQQTREKENELRQTEAKLKAFRDKYLDMLPEYTAGHVTSLESLRQRQADLKARVAAASAGVQAAKDELKLLSGVDESRVSGAQPYQVALSAAKVRLAEAKSSGLGESHPEVVRLTEQVASLESEYRKALAAEPTATEFRGNRGVTEVRRALSQRDVEAQAASAELGQVTEQIARLESIVRETPGVAEAYAELTRSYSVNTETNQRLLRELDEVRVQLNLEKASAEKRYEIVLPPRSLPIPIRKTLAVRAAVGGGIGLALGSLVALFLFLRAWMRERPQRMARSVAAATGMAGANALRGTAAPLPSLPAGPDGKA